MFSVGRFFCLQKQWASCQNSHQFHDKTHRRMKGRHLQGDIQRRIGGSCPRQKRDSKVTKRFVSSLWTKTVQNSTESWIMQDHAETRSEHVGAQERSRWGDVCTIYNMIIRIYIYPERVVGGFGKNFLLDWVGGAFFQIRLVDPHVFFSGPKMSKGIEGLKRGLVPFFVYSKHTFEPSPYLRHLTPCWLCQYTLFSEHKMIIRNMKKDYVKKSQNTLLFQREDVDHS